MTIDGYVLDLARDCQGVFTIERILEQYLFCPFLLESRSRVRALHQSSQSPINLPRAANMQRATISVMRRWQLLRKATPAGHVANASNSNGGRGSGSGSGSDSGSGKISAPYISH